MRKKASLILTIPEPCIQVWNDMTPVEDGRFCRHCQKKVIDFSAMTDEEILAVLSRTSQACGRFLPAQLTRDLVAGSKQRYKLFPAALLTTFLAAIIPGNSKAQQQMAAAGQSVAIQHPVIKGSKPLIFEGTITDALTSQGLPGVSIAWQGTDIVRAITDETGRFYLSISAGAAGQVFTFKIIAIGYQSKEVAFTYEQLKVNPVIPMQQAITELKELVVTGYATTQVHMMTGAVTVTSNIQGRNLNTPPGIKPERTGWWQRVRRLFLKKYY